MHHALLPLQAELMPNNHCLAAKVYKAVQTHQHKVHNLKYSCHMSACVLAGLTTYGQNKLTGPEIPPEADEAIAV